MASGISTGGLSDDMLTSTSLTGRRDASDRPPARGSLRTTDREVHVREPAEARENSQETTTAHRSRVFLCQ